jgi:hypothetical protein
LLELAAISPTVPVIADVKFSPLVSSELSPPDLSLLELINFLLLKKYWPE